MKIAQIGSFPTDITLIKGGVEASVYGLSVALAHNHDVKVFDRPRFESFDSVSEIEKLMIYRFSNKRNSNTFSLLRIPRIIREVKCFNPDICHLHTTSLFSLFCFILLSFKQYPVLVTVHGLAHIEKKNIYLKVPNLKNRLKYYSQSITEFIYLSICKNCIVDTNYVFEEIKNYKIQNKIFRQPVSYIIPQGVNEAFFKIKNKSKSNHLLAVGSLNNRKGHLKLIESMIQIVNEITNTYLSIVGIKNDDNYYDQLVSKINEFHLLENIKIFPNTTFDEILLKYSESDLFVLHTQEESQGIVFCEAMAAGKPIVSTNVGGVPWVVKDQVNGLLSDYGDIDTFAKNIILLLNDETIRLRMAETNRIQSYVYDWKTIAEKVLNVYNTLI